LRGRRKAAVYKVVLLRTGIERVVYDTRFDRFLYARHIPLVHLAIASGHSRQYILKVRSSRLDPTVAAIRNLTAGCIAITGDEKITPLDLFDLAPDAKMIAAARERDEQHEGPDRRREIAARGHTYRRRRRST